MHNHRSINQSSTGIISHLTTLVEYGFHHRVVQNHHAWENLCSRCRKHKTDLILFGYCNHDISAHEILGMIQYGKVVFLVAAAAVPCHPRSCLRFRGPRRRGPHDIWSDSCSLFSAALFLPVVVPVQDPVMINHAH